MRFGVHYLNTYIPELEGSIAQVYRNLIEQIQDAKALRRFPAHDPRQTGAAGALSGQEVTGPKSRCAAFLDQLQEVGRRYSRDPAGTRGKITILTGVGLCLDGSVEKASHVSPVASIMLSAGEASDVWSSPAIIICRRTLAVRRAADKCQVTLWKTAAARLRQVTAPKSSAGMHRGSMGARTDDGMLATAYLSLPRDHGRNW